MILEPAWGQLHRAPLTSTPTCSCSFLLTKPWFCNTCLSLRQLLLCLGEADSSLEPKKQSTMAPPCLFPGVGLGWDLGHSFDNWMWEKSAQHSWERLFHCKMAPGTHRSSFYFCVLSYELVALLSPSLNAGAEATMTAMAGESRVRMALQGLEPPNSGLFGIFDHNSILVWAVWIRFSLLRA